MKKTMTLHRLAAGLMVFIMTFALCLPFSTSIVKAKDTTYTVRIYAGKRGTISGKAVKEYKEQAYGSEITFDISEVKVNDSKYYVRGIREAGKDNRPTLDPPSFTVTKDQDFVVAYGIKGSSVTYTVNYVDKSGKKLRASKKFEGNVGDKPVVAYHYIDGYFPQAKNLTGTLNKDASKNQFNFVYTPKKKVSASSMNASTKTAAKSTTRQKSTTSTTRQSTTSTTRQSTTSTTRQSTSANRTTSTTSSSSSTTGTSSSTTSASTTGTTATASASTPTTSTQTPTNPDEVPDLIDIDDQTAQADFDSSDQPEEATTQPGESAVAPAPAKNGMSTPAKVGVGIGSVAAIAAAAAALYYFLVYKNPAAGNKNGEGGDGEDEDLEDEADL